MTGLPTSSSRPAIRWRRIVPWWARNLRSRRGHPHARIAVADRRLADVAQPATEREVRPLDGVHQRRPVDGLGDREGERRVALELGQAERRAEAPDDRVDEVGEDVLRVVELDTGEIRRVAGDVGDDETGWFGLVEHARVPPWLRRRRCAPTSSAGPRIAVEGIVSTWLRRRRSSGSTGTRSRSRIRGRSTSRRPVTRSSTSCSYYLAVADGALRGAGGRPMALKRFVDGAAGQPFFQKRAPENLPDVHPDRDAHVPVGTDRRRDRHRRRGGTRLGRQPRLHRPQPAPGPGRGPRPSRRAAGRPRPGAGRRRGRRSGEVALAARESLEAVGLVGWPKTSGSRGIHINVRIEPRWTYPGGPAGRAGARPRRRTARARTSPPRSGGRRSATASSSTTTRTPRTGRWRRPIRSGRCPTPVSRRR